MTTPAELFTAKIESTREAMKLTDASFGDCLADDLILGVENVESHFGGNVSNELLEMNALAILNIRMQNETANYELIELSKKMVIEHFAL